MKPPRKKSAGEIDRELLVEPAMTNADWTDYEEGWRLFNDLQFWHAHEAWERVWLRKPDESRIFFQGIIQLAAAFHLALAKKRYSGALRNFEKAEEKLKLFPEHFLSVNVGRLIEGIGRARNEIQRTGEGSLREFDRSIIPTVICEKPRR